MSVLPYITEYQQLAQLHRLENLSIDQIIRMEQLGSMLSNQAEESASPLLSASIRLGSLERKIQLTSLGPRHVLGFSSQHVPGTLTQLRIEDSTENLSYLYHVQVLTCTYQVDKTSVWELKLQFQGNPVVLRWGIGRCSPPCAVQKLENKLLAA